MDLSKEKDNRTPEQQELIELRKRNKKLEMRNDISKQAVLILAQKQTCFAITLTNTVYQQCAKAYKSVEVLIITRRCLTKAFWRLKSRRFSGKAATIAELEKLKPS